MRINDTIYDANKSSRILRRFGFWAPIGTALLGPALLNHQYKQKGRSAEDRRTLVFQEGASQAVSVATHVTSFSLGSRLARYILPKKFKGIGPAALEVLVTLAASVGSFIGTSTVRPIVSAKLLDKWENNKEANGGGQKAAKPQPAQPAPAAPQVSPFAAPLRQPGTMAAGAAGTTSPFLQAPVAQSPAGYAASPAMQPAAFRQFTPQ